jgi:DNA-binding NtrC family response regulator
LIELHRGASGNARELLSATSTVAAESRRALLTSEFIGDTYLEEGDAQTALDRYNSVWPLAIALVPKGDIVAELRRRRAEALYILGQYEQAYIEAKGALDHCRELGDRYEEAATYRTLAQAAAKLGRPIEAKQWFDQGFAYYEDIETPYEWGKLWMAYGDWLLSPESGDYADKKGAIEAYRAASDLFERMGSQGLLAKVTERLRAQNTEPRPAPQTLAVEPRRPARRPRGSAELERRSEWAKTTYGFITRNKVVLDLLADVAKLARSRSPILILGESGTGKDLVARGVHKLSERTGNFMPINCGALPREVIESELFGHVAGAFTGAMRDKQGIFESCHRGTVFLDEIAEMSPELQTRLLRFLESGEFRRVGSTKNVAVDTLVVAATNRDRGEMERGEGFRTDLYYRLAHAVVVLPPLRRRGDDLDLLIDHVLVEACRRQSKQVALSTEARNRLLAYSWPGNVRQLLSTIQRLVILSGDHREIGADEVVLDQSHAPANLTEELELAERRRIAEALAAASGVRTDAAKMLGMSRTTLISKMQRYGIR